ncbi:MAG: hypothetical protein PGN13_14910 [Patulibacter minatonensis]
MPRPFRLAPLAAGVTIAALAATATSAGATAPTATKPATSDDPVVLHWKAKPRGGDGANVINEQWLGMTRYPEWHIISRNRSKANRSTESWDGPGLSVRADGPLDTPLAGRLDAGFIGCDPGDASQLAAERAYSVTLRSLWAQVGELRAHAGARATLPAGPRVRGRATVEALVFPAPTMAMSPPATYVDFDATTGAVLRTREAEDIGNGPHPGPSYQDYSVWELLPATKATLAKVRPPAAVAARC